MGYCPSCPEFRSEDARVFGRERKGKAHERSVELGGDGAQDRTEKHRRRRLQAEAALRPEGRRGAGAWHPASRECAGGSTGGDGTDHLPRATQLLAARRTAESSPTRSSSRWQEAGMLAPQGLLAPSSRLVAGWNAPERGQVVDHGVAAWGGRIAGVRLLGGVLGAARGIREQAMLRFRAEAPF